MGEVTVVDASALIAFVDNEPGADKVAGLVERSAISTVNWAEFVQVTQRRDPANAISLEEMEDAGMTVVPLTAAQAQAAGEMEAATRNAGLSLADRCCLALALELEATALTSDRSWATLDVGVDVEVIR